MSEIVVGVLHPDGSFEKKANYDNARESWLNFILAKAKERSKPMSADEYSKLGQLTVVDYYMEGKEDVISIDDLNTLIKELVKE